MTQSAATPGRSLCTPPARRFEAVIVDWDDTAPSERQADALRVRALVEEACAAGLELAVVSSTHVGDIDGYLAARPGGPGGLLLALGCGSEVFYVDRYGPQLLYRRTASSEEDAALSRAAQMTVELLTAQGILARIVSERPNRRTIEVALKPSWPDSAKVPGDERLMTRRASLTGPGNDELTEAVETARRAAADAGVCHPRVSSDARHVQIGLTDKADSVQWVVSRLWQQGVAPEQVLVVGVKPAGVPATVWVGGGPGALATVLEDQIARRRQGELPIAVKHPEWTLAIEGIDRLHERVHESLLTLVDGSLGTRGTVIGGQSSTDATVLMSGVYTRTGAHSHLLAGPGWNTISIDDSSTFSVHRVLDLHTGVLHQQLRSKSGAIDSLALSSLAHPGTVALRVRDRSASMRVSRSLRPPSGPTHEEGVRDGAAWMRVRGRPGSIVAAADDQLRGSAHDRVLDRVAAYVGVPRGAADENVALDRLGRARRLGFDGLLAGHRRAWASRWEDADIRIDGDPDLQLAVRLAIFHLLASASDGGEAAVGARGLTGQAYRGHVFWDTDVYVLPVLAATHPHAARAVLEYRVRRLPQAIRAARAQRREGARFPWESAWSGREVTPQKLRNSRGQLVPIVTGKLEEHIIADVAWAAACYVDWTDDKVFASGAGRELIVQTARWWASRIELDEDGRGHIRGVIGPDEYHERVDDDAYTNVMARWNLRRAAAAADLEDRERSRWLELADAIVDGYDSTTGIYEQFVGFHALEPLVIADLAPHRPVDADKLLGRERVRSAQVVKQPDVLMLHYLVPDEVAPGSLQPNLNFYEPRTALGSTLSAGVHAALLARTGQFVKAKEMLRLTAHIDLDDIGGTAAGGLHLAAMGGVWRALTFGFAGLRPVGDALAIDPLLPPGWDALEIRVRFRNSRVRLRVQPGLVEVSADPPVCALTPGGERVQLRPTPRTFELST